MADVKEYRTLAADAAARAAKPVSQCERITKSCYETICAGCEEFWDRNHGARRDVPALAAALTALCDQLEESDERERVREEAVNSRAVQLEATARRFALNRARMDGDALVLAARALLPELLATRGLIDIMRDKKDAALARVAALDTALREHEVGEHRDGTACYDKYCGESCGLPRTSLCEQSSAALVTLRRGAS